MGSLRVAGCLSFEVCYVCVVGLSVVACGLMFGVCNVLGGCVMLVVRCSMFRCVLLGCVSLVGCMCVVCVFVGWLYVVRCLLLVVGCVLSLVVCCVLRVVRGLVAWLLLFVV